MKFAQLMNDVPVNAGASHRCAFSADNIQGLLIRCEDVGDLNDIKLNANVGSVFNVARCSLLHLHYINAFDQGIDPLLASGAITIYVNLGSIWLNTNEELELIIDNESSNNAEIDLSVMYDADEPNEIITYQNLVDTNFARENCKEIWAFGSSLGDTGGEEVMTIQDSMGSATTKVKVFNSYTNAFQNTGMPSESYAQVYADDDGILQKVTASITGALVSSGAGVHNFIVICDDTDAEKQAEKNTKYVAKKKAKLASLPLITKKLNKLKGKL